MRPYTDDDGKTPSKRTRPRRGQKAINGVKKSITKAKVTVVKTKRKIQASGQNGEEIDDLLEQTTNGQPGTPLGNKVIEKTTKASTAAKQMKKLKSLVKVNDSEAKTPTRRSKRISVRNGEIPNDISMAEEAVEANGATVNGVDAPDGPKSKSGGLFQRTISKIWRIPEGITGVPYSDIESPQASPEAPTPKVEEEKPAEKSANTSCVIS